MGRRRLEMRLEGVSTSTKPAQMKRMPVSFMSEKAVPYSSVSHSAEAGTAAISPKVMKCSYVMSTLRLASMFAAVRKV